MFGTLVVHDGPLALAVAEHTHHVHQQRPLAPALLALSRAVQVDVGCVVSLDTRARCECELEDSLFPGEGGGVEGEEAGVARERGGLTPGVNTGLDVDEIAEHSLGIPTLGHTEKYF